jgi:co-chaperonin GroES (HSP10)
MKLNSKLVLVRCDPPKEQDESGVFIQEEWVTNQPIGVVESVSDDVKFCKKGDKVWFERYTSIPYPEDKDLRMCREDAILSVL